MSKDAEVSDEKKIAILRDALAATRGVVDPKAYLIWPNIALRLEVTGDQVQAVVTKHGWPRPASMARALAILEGRPAVINPRPEPADLAARDQASQSTETGDAKTMSVGELMRAAKTHEVPRIRDAAAKVDAAIAKLREVLSDYQTKAAERSAKAAERQKIRAEIARREAEIKSLRDKLRVPPAPPTTTAPKGEYPCENPGCTRVLDTPQGRSLHQRMRCQHRPQESK